MSFTKSCFYRLLSGFKLSIVVRDLSYFCALTNTLYVCAALAHMVVTYRCEINGKFEEKRNSRRHNKVLHLEKIITYLNLGQNSMESGRRNGQPAHFQSGALWFRIHLNPPYPNKYLDSSTEEVKDGSGITSTLLVYRKAK